MLAEAVTHNVEKLPVRVMFQDEARFGRLSDPRRCWAPWPQRPLVKKALIREYVYAYAAVTPADGQLEWMLGSKMDTMTMNVFLQQVSAHHGSEFGVNGAGRGTVTSLCPTGNSGEYGAVAPPSLFAGTKPC